MAFGYLVLAIVLAVTLNAQNRWLRAAGTALAALSLIMIVISILLADFDGTFAAIPQTAPLIDRLTPAILNSQAALAGVGIAFLLWSAWQQARRPVETTLPPGNTEAAYGRVSRYLHWGIAVMMLCLIPIGLFMAILPAAHPERASFVAAHQALGLTVLGLAVVRIGWFAVSPSPRPASDLAVWEVRAARAVRIALYLALLAFPVSGYILSASEDTGIDFYGWALPVVARPSEAVTSAAAVLHNWCLPILFYVAIGLHVGAVLKRHFSERRHDAVRRMLR